MENKRQKMSIEDRAKQFAPFSALRGLGLALSQAEKVVVAKADIPEEKAEEIDRKLREVLTGTIVTLVYYENCEYLELTGMVAKIDFDKQIIQIVNKEISFKDIKDIK